MDKYLKCIQNKYQKVHMALTSTLLGDDFGFHIFVLDIQLCM